jgi:hypothetical protein
MEESVQGFSRRKLLQRGGAALLASFVHGAAPAFSLNPPELTAERPKPADRRFRSEVVEQYLTEVRFPTRNWRTNCFNASQNF